MIAQITPLVQAAKRRTWLAIATSHALGSTLSASVLGLALGTIGFAIGLRVWQPVTGLLIGLVLFAGAVRDAGIIRWPLPSLKRQTSAWFPRVMGWVGGAFLWGTDLGQGWTTLISFAGYYALVLGALLIANPIRGTLLLGAYGLGRALPVLAAGLNLHSMNISSRSTWYVEHQSMIYQINAATLAFIAGYFLRG